jgi:hypothetical protein
VSDASLGYGKGKEGTHYFALAGDDEDVTGRVRAGTENLGEGGV